MRNFFFTEVLWPDFNESEFEKAINCFDLRERRFGKTGEQAKSEKFNTDKVI
jgi:undecaprenyl diphosphate synthase